MIKIAKENIHVNASFPHTELGQTLFPLLIKCSQNVMSRQIDAGRRKKSDCSKYLKLDDAALVPALKNISLSRSAQNKHNVVVCC